MAAFAVLGNNTPARAAAPMPMGSTLQVGSWTELSSAIAGVNPGESATIELTQNIPAQGHAAIAIEGGRDIVLTSAGGVFTLVQETANQRHFAVRNGTLTLRNIVLSGNQANLNNHGGVSVSAIGVGAGAAAHLYMEAGSEIANNRAPLGGGVNVANGGTLVIRDGEIRNNQAAGTGGGGVHMATGAEFTMERGAIRNNHTTSHGGGLFATGNSRFEMTGGVIRDNTAANNGGGIHAAGGTSVIIRNGAVVEQNEAAVDGGGVTVIGNSSFEMDGGTIRGNGASSSGGGVQVWGGAAFIMRDGEITNNTSHGAGAGTGGGGVVVTGVNSTFEMNGGAIRENNATANGGGVQLMTGGTLIMHGGAIADNTSHGTGALFGGGGVNIGGPTNQVNSWGIFTMHGGEIRGNYAVTNGGGVRRGSNTNAYFTMHGGEIRDNTAGLDGGGIYAQGEVYRPVLEATDYARITMGDHGLVRGAEGIGGAFLPDQLITRAEAAAIINRMLNRLPESPADMLPNMRTWPDNMNPQEWYYLYIQEATNSHTHEIKADGIHERWMSLLPPRPWALLERPNSRPEDIF